MSDDAPQGELELTIEDQPQGETEAEIAEPEPQGPDWKSQSRKHEARAKKAQSELKELRDQIQQMLSPEQVADKDAALADAVKGQEAALIEATKYRVALAEGLPLELAVRLQGGTEDEMREDAERLKELVKPSSNVRSDIRKATNPAPQVDPPDANDLLRQIVAGKR
jgi:hypothetical protein